MSTGSAGASTERGWTERASSARTQKWPQAMMSSAPMGAVAVTPRLNSVSSPNTIARNTPMPITTVPSSRTLSKLPIR